MINTLDKSQDDIKLDKSQNDIKLDKSQDDIKLDKSQDDKNNIDIDIERLLNRKIEKHSLNIKNIGDFIINKILQIDYDTGSIYYVPKSGSNTTDIDFIQDLNTYILKKLQNKIYITVYACDIFKCEYYTRKYGGQFISHALIYEHELEILSNHLEQAADKYKGGHSYCGWIKFEFECNHPQEQIYSDMFN